MNQNRIGKFIANQRKLKNLTQEQLAEKLGITKNLLANGNVEFVLWTCLY